MDCFSEMDLLRLVLVSAGLLATLGIAEFVRRRFGVSAEVSRKAVHIGTGVLILFAPGWFPRAEPVLLITALFILLNIYAYATGLLASVHRSSRRSFGTIYYPLAFLVLTPLFWERAPDLVVASMLVLALGDGAAAAVGESVRSPHLYRITSDQKSIEGTIAMVVATMAALAITVWFLPPFSERIAPVLASPVRLGAFVFAVSLFAAAWEAASSRGLDNLTVPLMTALVLSRCLYGTSIEHIDLFIVATGLALLTSVLSYKARFLQYSGAVATFLLATIVYGFGGWMWTLPILTFFLSSSILSRTGRLVKHRLESLYEKGATRDAGQVLANGGTAGIIVVLSVLFPDPRWYLAYLGSIAAVTADTWATELGAFSRKSPRNIVSFKRVEKGSSGAVSVTGSAGGLFGAVVTTAVGLLFLPMEARTATMVACLAGCGLAGSGIDSLLGATLQARFRCAICGNSTERRTHCGSLTAPMRGVRWMSNDAVNAICACSGAVFALLLFQLFA
jgi:uncharacterized protein (TIGR00297 family)